MIKPVKVNENLYIIYTGPKHCVRHISTYVVIDFEYGEIGIIDPGPRNSYTMILKGLEDLDALRNTRVKIILTHIHLDHAGSATILAKKINAEIYVHPIGIKHIENPEKLWSSSKQVLGWLAEEYGKPEQGYGLNIIEIKDGEIIKIGDMGLKAIYTPGHASHHISFHVDRWSLTFVGDAAGVYHGEVNATYPTTPPPFRYREYVESLDKLINLRSSVLAYPHSGITDDISILKKHRVQIELWWRLIESGIDTIDKLALNDENFRKIYTHYGNGEKLCEVEKVILSNSILGLSEEIKRTKL